MNREPIEEVEQFYARQRAEILERVGRTATRPSSWSRRNALLAAAAMLALTVVGLSLVPPPASEGFAADGLVVNPTSLPLSPYAAWSDDDLLDRDDVSDMGSVDWLLDNDNWLLDSRSLPSFLEPFGSWPEGRETTAEISSVWRTTTATEPKKETA